MKKVKTDISTFENLIKENYLYIDKTDFVWNLVNGKGIYFMSRPRRFGKSLLLTTFDAYFSAKKELFKGLKIEKLAPEKWEVYPIIRLEMSRLSDCKTPDSLRDSLGEIIRTNARVYDINIESIKHNLMFYELIDKLYAKTGKPVVVLVDEYDKPILDNILNDNVNDILEVIKAFYQVMKDQNGKEQFVFITGVTKFSHTSIFSGMNNPTDLTMDPRYATMLGYTQKELEENFKEYIPEAAKYNDVTEEELIKRLKEEYDGFRFEEGSESVYNPISIGKFFETNKFNNYWMGTGTPKFLYEVAKKTRMDIEDKRNRYIDELSFEKYDVNKLDPFIFAVQCGYLTIKDSKKIGIKTHYLMDYPNNEVRDTFSKFLFTAYTGRTEDKSRQITEIMRQSLEKGDTETFLQYLKGIIAGLAWGNVGEDDIDPIRFYEGYFRNIISLTMTILNIENEPEVRTSDGQIDLMCHLGEWRFLFELKAGEIKSEQDTEKLLDKAMQQAEERKYHEKYLNNSVHINIIALAFDMSTRKLADSRVNTIK